MFKWFGRAWPALACLALNGCFLQPGKFNSTFDLRKDGTFTFSYKGQIYMLALSKIADLATKAQAQSAFVQQPCRDQAFNEHTCSAEEIAKQRRDWEGQRQKKLQDDKASSEMMRSMLGGIDPADPAAAKELAERMRHQAGWHTVNYLGDGLFEVDFSISSKMTHDFAFPILERFPMSNVFVMATGRSDGTVRIEAPGFTGQSSTTGLGAMAGAMGAAAASDAAKTGATEKDATSLGMPQIDGMFKIVTDAEVLANNTDEGPHAGAGGEVLQWQVTRRTQVAPMALVRLAP